MSTLQDSESLYKQGNFSACLESLNTFLLFNNDQVEALLLKAKCEYEIAAYSAQQDEDDHSLFTIAYNSFEYILQLQPTEETAMLYAVYINAFIIHINLPEAKVYCDILALSDDEAVRVKALQYRRKINFSLGEIDLVLEDLDLTITYYRDLFHDNRSMLDQELSPLYLEKAEIYLWHKKDAQKVFETFNQGKTHSFNYALTNCNIANLALDEEQFEIAGEAALRAVKYGDDESRQDLLDLYQRINELNLRNKLDKGLAYTLLLALRIYSEVLTDDGETLSLTKKYIDLYPDWHVPHHFAGTFWFDRKHYEKAFPYLKRSLELGGMAPGIRRYIEAGYHLTGQLPELKNWPDDNPEAFYNAAVDFYYLTETEISNESLAPELLKIRTKLYEISYNGFYNYFYNNIPIAAETSENQVHTFAKCSNNYGIALTEMGEFERAVEVHTLGYSLSPFWEQLSSWGNALKKSGRFEEAIDVLGTAASYYFENYMYFSNYLEIRGEVLQMTYELGRVAEARELLDQITSDYDGYITANQGNLTEEQLFELNEKYIIVQNTRYDLLNQGSKEDAIKTWQEELVKNPDDNTAWYMLMQEYYQLKDYPQCIACANNYQMVKKEAIQPESLCKIHYMRGRSQMFLGNYAEAITDFNPLVDLLVAVYPDDDQSESCRNFMQLTESHYMLKQWDLCVDTAYKAIRCYIDSNWGWDDDLVKVKLQYADALHAIKLKGEAMENINNILESYPDNEEALKRKKEWKTGLFSFFKG